MKNRDQGSVVRDQEKTEDKSSGQGSVVRDQEKTEDRRQKTDIRGQKTEVDPQITQITRIREKGKGIKTNSGIEGFRNLYPQITQITQNKKNWLTQRGNGEWGSVFSEKDVPEPQDAYGVSKWEAEQLLAGISSAIGMEIVIIRPPLVYGPNVRANFLRLLRWVKKGIPLPLGMVNNRRSLVSLDNLVDFLVTCIEHPRAAGETFLVSDGEDLSTPALIRRIALSMNIPARLIPVPVCLLRLGGSLLGKKPEVDRLCGSLQVDIGKAKGVLGWKPPLSLDEGLAKTAAWYLNDETNN